MILVKKLILFLQELFLLLALVTFEQEQVLMEKMWEHLLNSQQMQKRLVFHQQEQLILIQEEYLLYLQGIKEQLHIPHLTFQNQLLLYQFQYYKEYLQDLFYLLLLLSKLQYYPLINNYIQMLLLSDNIFFNYKLILLTFSIVGDKLGISSFL